MGSESRKRKHVVAVRLSDEERYDLEKLAAERGLSLSDYTRAVLLERVPLGVGVRRRVPHAADKPLSELSLAVTSWLAELGKTGSNLNQLAHHANAGYAVPQSKLAKYLSEWQHHTRIARDFHKRLYEALGISLSETADLESSDDR